MQELNDNSIQLLSLPSSFFEVLDLSIFEFGDYDTYGQTPVGQSCWVVQSSDVIYKYIRVNNNSDRSARRVSYSIIGDSLVATSLSNNQDLVASTACLTQPLTYNQTYLLFSQFLAFGLLCAIFILLFKIMFKPLFGGLLR